MVPQVCLLFGPSAAGGAYIPAFCDVVVMVDGNASMYLGSPRMAEMVIGEKVTLEEMGGAKMHCRRLGLRRRARRRPRRRRSRSAKRYLALPARRTGERAAAVERRGRRQAPAASALDEIIPADENKPFDMHAADRRG